MTIACKIIQIGNIYERNSNRLLQKYDLTLAQMKILKFLEHRKRANLGSVHQHDIEREFLLSNPAVTRLLDRLEEKNFIQRCPDPEDRRAKIIQTLSKTQEFKASAIQDYQKLEKQMLSGFEPEELEQLASMLNRLLTNLCPSFSRKGCFDGKQQTTTC
ncbi:MAG: MarR family transcriptional regulator [Clostridia bacterium]|nr:MarR family transcriptional regulator [Clostridia bacterium]